MSEAIEPLAGRPVARMSEAEYEQERAKLRALYGESPQQAGAKREQAMALLFARSGWTQEELAKKEGRSQPYISQLLRFGRFLNIAVAISPNTPLSSLNEGRFRSYWERTDKTDGSERERFVEVLRMIEAKMPARRPIGPAIVETFADGEWHLLADIATSVAGGDEKFVAKTMENILYPHARIDATAERRKHGKSYEYRIFREASAKAVPLAEIRTKLGPIIKRLVEQGKKNMATMSPPTVRECAFLLEQQIRKWGE